jgi:two-component system chemotaxis response regulator CheY
MKHRLESRLTHGPAPLTSIVLAGKAELDARLVILSALTFAGYRVRLAGTSDDLLRESLGDGVDLVLSDIHLKCANGDSAIDALKHVRELKHLGVLAYSSSPAPNDEAFARSIGADAFLGNPADLAALFDTVASMLAAHKAQRRLVSH